MKTNLQSVNAVIYLFSFGGVDTKTQVLITSLIHFRQSAKYLFALPGSFGPLPLCCKMRRISYRERSRDLRIRNVHKLKLSSRKRKMQKLRSFSTFDQLQIPGHSGQSSSFSQSKSCHKLKSGIFWSIVNVV